MGILLQLQVEPGELHQADWLEASPLENLPGYVVIIEDRLRHPARLQGHLHQLIFVHRLPLQSEASQGLPYDLLRGDAGGHGDGEGGGGHPELPGPHLDHSEVIFIVPQSQQDSGASTFLSDQSDDRLGVLVLIFRLCLIVNTNYEQISIPGSPPLGLHHKQRKHQEDKNFEIPKLFKLIPQLPAASSKYSEPE